MKSNFNPLSAEELVSRINKIPRVQLAQLPTVLEYAPNISKELNINLFIKRGEKKENIKFFIGPHLKFKSFEVQRDFIENIKQIKNFSIYLKENQNKIFFNYTKLIEDKIKELGIDSYKTSGFDTYSNPKKFFSHRYSMKNELKDCGRQISLVGCNK